MRLKDLVYIDSRFEKSVNLLLDLNDGKKVKAYIPTRSSVNLLKSYLEEVSEYSGRRANILIGPYGKGKSHLLLILMAILSGSTSEELDKLVEKISSIDHNAGELIRQVNSSSKFLPVIINTNSGNLGQAFVRSLNQALKREGLGDIVPENYFSEALSTIRQWKNIYPSTYTAMQNLLKEDVESFIHRLDSYDYDALNDFRRIHPLVTSGSDFNPIIDDEAISVYRSVNRLICEKYGYTGIYIIFDEFSKYIEGHAVEGFSADMKLLQDICELCNSSKDEQMHLTCVAHKAIRAYGDSLSKVVMNSFRGVEGRLVEIPFIVSSQNNYELIADAILKEPSFEEWKENNTYRRLLEDSYQIPEFSALFDKNDFDIIVGNGCFPLTPLAALLLVNLSEKIAQNERTIFTFLSGKDLHSLMSFVENSKDIFYVGADLIYDYFQSLFEDDKNTKAHSEWIKADFALSKTDNLDERVIIKSLAIIKMVNRADDIPAKAEFLHLASGMGKDSFSNALNSLVEKEIVSYKKKTATFDFQNSIGVNIENEIADCAFKYFSKIDIPSVLNEVCLKRYILPKKYNQEYFMTRYYKIVFMSAESFLALSSPDYITDSNSPDGYLIVICENGNVDNLLLQKHLQELKEDRFILGIPEIPCNLYDTVRTLLSVRKLMLDKEFISENEVLLTEFHAIETELVEILNQWIQEATSSIKNIYYQTESYSVGYFGLNRAVSDLCEKAYDKTVMINHELINRHCVSAQISKARNTIMDDMLHGRLMEKYDNGTSAESTIYRALMIHTKNDENLPLVKNEIIEFIHDSKGKKVPFSKLIGKLTSKPYGMRKGPMPVYILEQLTELEDMPVIYLGKKELAIDATIMANVVQNSKDYYLYVEEETGQKLEYIEGLEKLFEDYGVYCREIEDRNRLSKLTCIIQSWFRSLPQTSSVFRKEDYAGQDIKKIDLFRKLFSGSVNPREALFDQIPKIFETNDLSKTLKEVESTKKDIDNHIHILKANAIDVIRNSLSLNSKDDLLRSIKTWYSELPDEIKNSLLSTDSQKLFRALRDVDQSDPEEIAEKLSKEITGFYIEDWNDNTINLFAAGLSQMLNEINDKINKKDNSVEQKIVFLSSKGKEEVFFDYDPENLSTTGYFFQNALDDIVEEYGESIENSEKIGILMQMIKKLMS